MLSGGDMVGAARVFGLMAGAWASMNFIASPILGALSDRYGRRRVILISAFGFSLDLLIMALAPTITWLFIGRAVSGLTAASYSAAAAYLADVTPPDQRARRFGWLSAVYATGMILGPAVGGALGEISPRAPFYAAAGLAALGWVYGLVVLPKSLPLELRTKVAWHSANPVRSFGILARDNGLLGLAGVQLLIQLASTAANTVFVLYAGFRYHWTSVDVGLLLMGFGAGNILVTGLIAPRLVERVGERATLLVGLVIAAISFSGLGLATTGLQFCVASILSCLGNVCGPPLQALETRRVGPTEQGRLQGALNGVTALSALAGPIFFSQVFAWSVAAGATPARSGTALLIGAGLMTIALPIAFALARPPESARTTG